MSDNKNKGPAIGLAFLLAASAGGYVGGQVLKPYYDTTVEYVKTDILQQDGERSIKKLSTEAEKLKQQCGEVGSQIGSIIADTDISASFSYTFEIPESKDSAGTCKMHLSDPSTGEPEIVAHFYSARQFKHINEQTSIIRGLMLAAPQGEMNKVAEVAPKIIAAFPKSPNP